MKIPGLAEALGFVQILVQNGCAPGLDIETRLAVSWLIEDGRLDECDCLLGLAQDETLSFAALLCSMSQLGREEQLLVLEARRELERLVSIFAARRANVFERQTHLEVAEQLRRADQEHNALLYLRLHFALKRFTAASARNPFIASALSPLHALSRAQRDFLDLAAAVINGARRALIAIAMANST